MRVGEISVWPVLLILCVLLPLEKQNKTKRNLKKRVRHAYWFLSYLSNSRTPGLVKAANPCGDAARRSDEPAFADSAVSKSNPPRLPYRRRTALAHRGRQWRHTLVSGPASFGRWPPNSVISFKHFPDIGQITGCYVPIWKLEHLLYSSGPYTCRAEEGAGPIQCRICVTWSDSTCECRCLNQRVGNISYFFSSATDLSSKPAENIDISVVVNF